MTTAVTKESLAARIAELESGARSLKEDYTLAAYKMLLATMEAKPIGAFHISEGAVEATSDYCKDGEWPVYNGVIEVYAVQRPLAVPDELLNEIDDLLSVCRVYACRSRRNGSENDIPRTEKAQNWLRAYRAAMLNQK